MDRSLTVKKTLIAISLTVNNTGDDVGGINLMVTEVPTFVTAVMFVKVSFASCYYDCISESVMLMFILLGPF